MSDSTTHAPLPRWLLAVLPLVLLAASLWLFVRVDPVQMLTGQTPPLESLSIQQIQLHDKTVELKVVNGGPDPVTVAQVQVDEAYWSFEMTPDRTIDRLGRATITIPYRWVHGLDHEITLVTSTGVTFSRTITRATETPRPNLMRWGLFALIGFFVGVVPVGLGLMWFPLLQQLGRRTMTFILALTVGLLVFLLVDTVLEGVEIAETIPDVFQALPLVFFVGLLSFLGLMAVGRRSSVADRTTPQGRRWVALAIALGIGLHNLGEGLVVGAAITQGEVALGSFLIVGFVLHNVTEGVGIGAPMADDAPGVWYLVGLVLLAGAPAIVGTWLGGFVYSPLMAVLFFAVGAGAILQVVVEVGQLVWADAEEGLASWINLGGVTAGLAVMYATALLV